MQEIISGIHPNITSIHIFHLKHHCTPRCLNDIANDSREKKITMTNCGSNKTTSFTNGKESLVDPAPGDPGPQPLVPRRSRPLGLMIK